MRRAFSRIGKSERLPPTIPTSTPVRAVTLLTLRLGEALGSVEDVELLDVGPAGMAGGHPSLELEQLGVDGVAAVDA